MERFEEGSNDIPSPARTTNINKRNATTRDEHYRSLLDSKISKMEENMKQLYNKIENKLEDMIHNKLSKGMRTIDKNDVVTSNKTYAEKVKESVIGCPNQHSTTENDFRAIMKDARNEELVQEQERKERSRNLIIHGVPGLHKE